MSGSSSSRGSLCWRRTAAPATAAGRSTSRTRGAHGSSPARHREPPTAHPTTAAMAASTCASTAIARGSTASPASSFPEVSPMSAAGGPRIRKRVRAPETPATPSRDEQPQRRKRGKPSGRPPLVMDVQWADIVKADGDVFVVGHYIGVLPQNAELALDIALSGTKDPARLVLTDLTRRGAIRGALGDVLFFPR